MISRERAKARALALYYAACRADRHLHRVIQRHAPGKDRWTLSREQHDVPEIKGAYDRKHAVDDARWRATTVLRGIAR